MNAAATEPSMGRLLGRLASDGSTLVRQELQLASVELSDRMRATTNKVGVVALGGGLAHVGLLGLLAAATLGLASVIPLWAAALILGAVFFVAGCAIARVGVAALRPPVPADANAPRLERSAKELRQ